MRTEVSAFDYAERAARLARIEQHARDRQYVSAQGLSQRATSALVKNRRGRRERAYETAIVAAARAYCQYMDANPVKRRAGFDARYDRAY